MVGNFGSQGGWVRIRPLLGLIFSMSLLAVLVATPAQAVHDLGAFELEGNATNGAAPGDDWDNVCHEVTVTNDGTIPDQCTTVGDTSAFGGATAVSWKQELNRSTSIFTGGGSKDPQNISEWAFKNELGGLPDKDNLEHGFAARYTVPQVDGTSCPTSIDGPTCDILYFGSDRFDNSGDAQEGFWFLQNDCSQGTVKSGGGFHFTCVDPTPTGDTSDDFHQVGDLLVLTDFSIGGTVSTIRVFKWVGSGGSDGSLDF